MKRTSRGYNPPCFVLSPLSVCVPANEAASRERMLEMYRYCGTHANCARRFERRQKEGAAQTNRRTQVTEHAKYRGISGSQRNTNYQRTSFSAASPSAARRSLRRCLGQQREPAERNSVDLHNPTCKGNNILLVMCTGTAGSYGLQRHKRLQSHRGLPSAH